MARPRKRLVDLVRDGTFLARKDEHLLAGRERLHWPELERFRRLYQRTPFEGRRQVALGLERRLREEGPAGLLGELRAELDKLGPRDSLERLLRFAPRFFRHIEGPLAGRPYHFPPNHRAFLEEFWRRDRYGRRVYQVGLLMEPKGCSKTPTAAVLGTYALVDESDAPKVSVIAGAKYQADFGHAFATRNILEGPLAAWLVPGNQTIDYPENWGEFSILSADGDLSAGINPTTGLFDELWLFRFRHQREAWNSQERALHKRSGRSYVLGISTAGYDKRTLLGERYDAALAHPKLEVLDDGYHYRLRDTETGFLFWSHQIPEDADIENPAVIRRATPAPWVKPRDLLRELHRPSDESDELDWRRLHGNQWTKTRTAWLTSSGVWARLRSETQIPEGAVIDVGIDAARTWDTTSVGWEWTTPEGRKVCRAHVWSVRNRVPHHTFVPGGELVNEELIEPYIHELASKYRIRVILLDPRYLAAEAKHLADAGFTVVKIEPQSEEMAEAVVLFEKRALAGGFEHDGDRVVAAHIDAIDSIRRPDGSKKIGKRNEGQPIDAGISLILANYGDQIELPAERRSSWRPL